MVSWVCLLEGVWMRNQSNRYVFTRAEPKDGKELLAILEEGDYSGNISLQYTRRPDAYVSLMREGVEVEIVVCRDLQHGKIVGYGACAINSCYINKTPQKVGYLFGLRMRKEYMGNSLVMHRAYAYLRTVLAERHVSYFYTSILAENEYAQKLLVKKRTFMPHYLYLTDYHVFSLKTANCRKKDVHYHFRKALKADIPHIVEFLALQGKNKDFFPVLTEADLLAGAPWSISYEDMVVLIREGRIVACGTCWDRSGSKQYIVKSYCGIYKYLQSLPFLVNVLGYPALPLVGSTLHFFTLSFWCVENDDPQIFAEFVNRIAEQTEYSFFNIGITTDSPLTEILLQKKHFLYKSKIYLVTWNEKVEYSALTSKGKIYIECGRL